MRNICCQVTERVAEEMGTFVGQDVGYSIRFDDFSDPNRTRIKVFTFFGTFKVANTARNSWSVVCLL